MRVCQVAVIVAVLTCTASAFAELPYTPHFVWTPPTTFADPGATALDPLEDLADYRLYCTPELTDTPQILPIKPPYEWSAPAGTFSAGEHTCYMTAVSTAKYGGLESSPSQSVTFTLDGLAPSPLIIFTID